MAKPEGKSDTFRPAPDGKASRGSGAFVAAALIGGGVSLAGAIGLDRLDVIDIFSRSQSVSSDEVAGLKQQLAASRASADAMGAELNAKITELSQNPNDASLGNAVDEIRSEIENLRGQMGDTADTTGAVDLAPLDERLVTLEKLVGSGGSGREVALEVLEERLAASADAIKDLKADLAGVSEKLNDTAAGQGESVAKLEAEIAALQGAVAEANARTEKVASSEAVQGAVEVSAVASRKADQAVAIAPVLAAESLQRAIEAGQPFEAALSAFDNLGIDDPALAVLQPYAAGGLPTQAALTAEFAEISEAMRDRYKVAADEEAGAVNRLLKGAFSIVEVRPAEPLEGTDPPAIRSRIQASLAAGNLTTAMSEWETLPDDDKTISQAWAEKAKAIALSRKLADTVRASALARLNTTR